MLYTMVLPLDTLMVPSGLPLSPGWQGVLVVWQVGAVVMSPRFGVGYRVQVMLFPGALVTVAVINEVPPWPVFGINNALPGFGGCGSAGL